MFKAWPTVGCLGSGRLRERSAEHDAAGDVCLKLHADAIPVFGSRAPVGHISAGVVIRRGGLGRSHVGRADRRRGLDVHGVELMGKRVRCYIRMTGRGRDRVKGRRTPQQRRRRLRPRGDGTLALNRTSQGTPSAERFVLEPRRGQLRKVVNTGGVLSRRGLGVLGVRAVVTRRSGDGPGCRTRKAHNEVGS